jgi:hypothetical protein
MNIMIVKIAIAHSHQSVLTRYVTEGLDLYGLRFTVLDMKRFPSGYHYHHEINYMATVRNFTALPNVFHMCWTESRKQKVQFLQELGMWFLPEDNTTVHYQQCSTVNGLKATALSLPKVKDPKDNPVLESCCERGHYWLGREKALLQSSRSQS